MAVFLIKRTVKDGLGESRGKEARHAKLPLFLELTPQSFTQHYDLTYFVPGMQEHSCHVIWATVHGSLCLCAVFVLMARAEVFVLQTISY